MLLLFVVRFDFLGFLGVLDVFLCRYLCRFRYYIPDVAAAAAAVTVAVAAAAAAAGSGDSGHL